MEAVVIARQVVNSILFAQTVGLDLRGLGNGGSRHHRLIDAQDNLSELRALQQPWMAFRCEFLVIHQAV
ncbi:MAG: hypothetical protein ACKO6N_29705, partial [Myxococcota bacterium]